MAPRRDLSLTMATTALFITCLCAWRVYCEEHQNTTVKEGEDSTHEEGGNGTHSIEGHDHGGVKLASWRFEHVQNPLLLSFFVVIAGFLKVCFHKMHFLSAIVPESCLLIITGVLFGAILKGLGHDEDFKMEPETFMLYLLPPIVLDASYSLVDRVFIENLVYVLLFAVVGTVLSFLFIGSTMYGIATSGLFGTEITLLENFLFASFIVAVDPVAVLSVFQEVGVNDTLYFLVFGESLLNDGVTIVLTIMMTTFLTTTVTVQQVILGIVSFFTIAVGGLIIGILYGIITCVLTKYTYDVSAVEPLFVLVIAYLSYLTAECVHWSGFISLIGCGMCQAYFAFHNINRKSKTTVVFFMKMLSSTAENLVFLYLGVEMLRASWVFNTPYVMLATGACLFYRFVITYTFCALINASHPARDISAQDQFVMWYGGLRGAVSYALCDALSPTFRHKQMFLTCTIFIVLFTVFIQGMTIKPIVKLCKVQRKSEEPTGMIEEITVRVIDHLMFGIEELIGQKGKGTIRSQVVNFIDTKCVRWLEKNPMKEDQKILEAFVDLVIEQNEQHLASLTRNASVYLHDPSKEPDGPREESSLKGGPTGLLDVGPIPKIAPIKEEEDDEIITVPVKPGARRRSTAYEHSRSAALVAISKMLEEGDLAEIDIIEMIKHKHRTDAIAAQCISSHKSLNVSTTGSEVEMMMRKSSMQRRMSKGTQPVLLHNKESDFVDNLRRKSAALGNQIGNISKKGIKKLGIQSKEKRKVNPRDSIQECEDIEIV